MARDICANLKSVVGGLRLFPPGHAVVAAYSERLQNCFRDFLEREGAFTIDVSPTALLVEGQPVLTSDSAAESISNPLFLDGVTDISFQADTPASELTLLCDIWSLSLATEADAGQTFTTRCWEAGFSGIRVVSVDSFVEHLSDEAERELESLVQSIEDEAAQTAASPVGAPLPRIRPSDLARLRAEGLVELAVADLTPPATPSPISLPRLTTADTKAMAAEIDSERARQSLPAVTALAFAGLEASEAERAEIASALEAVFIAVARATGLAQVRQTVSEFVAAANTDSDGPQRRFAALEIVLEGLGRPALLSLATAGIKGPPLDPTIDGLLAFLQGPAAPALLDCIAGLPQPAGELLMPRLLALKPRAETLQARIARTPAYVAHALLQYATTLKEEDRIATYIAAVAHAHPDVRHLAATRVPRANLLARPETLYPLVSDSDPGLRQLAISVVLTAKDDAVAPYLVQLLDIPDFPLPERRRVIRSLGAMPTREVIVALRKEFRTQPNAETLATCALALGRTGDEVSRGALQATASKLFANAELKKACLDALRLLDARKAASEKQERV